MITGDGGNNFSDKGRGRETFDVRLEASSFFLSLKDENTWCHLSLLSNFNYEKLYLFLPNEYNFPYIVRQSKCSVPHDTLHTRSGTCTACGKAIRFDGVPLLFSASFIFMLPAENSPINITDSSSEITAVQFEPHESDKFEGNDAY